MKRLAKLDRLLRELQDRIVTPLPDAIGLRFRRAAADDARDATYDDWQPVTADLVWGEPESYFWFSAEVTLPEAAAGRRLLLLVDAAFGDTMGRSDPQCLVRVDGRIVQAADGNHRSLLLADPAEAGRSYHIDIEAGTIEDRRQLGFGLRLGLHDLAAEQLYFDLKVPLDVARLLKPDDPRALAVIGHVDAALRRVDLRPGDPARFAMSLSAAAIEADRIYAMGEDSSMPVIVAAGHTHIDVAWLWRVRETRRKMARSMATALALLDQYPDYRFMYNQGLLFDWLDSDYPELMERIRGHVAAGRFEVEGALWLEPDVNLSSGESLVRHLLRGIRYHESTFGIRPRLLWLPDTFGYSPALPQLMAQTGVETFVTHKLSWNDTNRIPHDTFFWEGIDGTRVPASFVTTQTYEYDGIETTYCANLRASHVLGTWKRHADKAMMPELFMIYGHGDGGGGPTREMVETIRRFERGIPGSPRVRQGALGLYFAALAGRMRAAPDAFPVWVGELYFECHRGTLTSVAAIKRANRKSEIRLREIELLAVLLAALPEPVEPVIDRDSLDKLWRILLLNQFHDILPGSSIGSVYTDALADVAAFTALADRLECGAATRLGEAPLLLNASHRRRGGLVSGPPRDGAQAVRRADGSTGWLSPVEPVDGSALARPAPAAPLAGTLSVGPDHLENDILRVVFNAAGHIVSLVDKRSGRDLVQPGAAANRLVAYRDIPVDFDAWDIGPQFEDCFWEIDRLVAAEIVETGPHRAAIRFEWRYEASRIVEIVSLARGADRLEIDGHIDWHEHQTLLKLHLPTSVAAAESRADIHFGHLARPTHRNTSWDSARFECLMHRWVDLSDADGGLAVLNDCKYGYDAIGGRLRITLLKSPVWPWPEADQGDHAFRLALMPHAAFADSIEAIDAAAEDLNMPLRWIGPPIDPATAPADPVALPPPPLTLVGEGVAIAAVKPAEDGDGIIVRLHEFRGRRAAITVATPHASVAAVDLLERDPRPLLSENGRYALAFSPFEIKTLKLGA